MSRFADKTVVVTGASRGLGRAVACAFAGEGARVWIGYHVRKDEAEQTRELVTKADGEGTLLPLDLRRTDAVETAFAEVLARDKGVDVLVNNAGLTRDGFMALMEDEAFDEVLDVNLRGVFRCSRIAAKSMIHRRSGAIVNVGSVAAHRASPGQVNYIAAKGGLEAFTRALAVELAPRGVRVNAVAPGLLATGMALHMDQRMLKTRQTQIPLGRSGEAEEVARTILFLASPDASYVVGQTLIVDGGLSL